MSLFDRFKADVVACDEILVVQDVETAVPIAVSLPPGSSINAQRSTVEVAVTECDLRIDPSNDRFTIDLSLLIVKEIVICPPTGPCLNLEFSFIKTFSGLAVTGCRPSQIPADLLRRLHCQIFDIQATDALRLNPAANTFDETLTVTTTVKIVVEQQLPIISPVPPVPPVPPTPVPPEVIAALEIVAAKIRAQIGDQATKARLLGEVDRAIALLEAGMVLEALAVLSDIVDELQLIFNVSPCRRIPVNLVLSDLERARKEVVGLL